LPDINKSSIGKVYTRSATISRWPSKGSSFSNTTAAQDAMMSRVASAPSPALAAMKSE
jgi:hypothetical protein